MTTAEPLAFGALLKHYRRAAGLTQEGLAERAGLSARGISDLERGVSRTHRADTIQRLASALGLAARERSLLLQAALGAGRPGPGLAAAPTAPQQPDALVPFVGRSHERALVDWHLSGQGAPVLLFAGEPGIGKSRLLQEAVAQASGRGWTVLEGGCQRRGGHGPYAPLLGALQRHLQGQSPVHLRTALQGCAWLVRLLPELAEGPIEPLPTWTLPPEQERRLMVEAVTRYLANVAGPAGTLLVLDDLQWAGSDALDLLMTLVRSGSTVPLRVLGAYRDTEVQPPDPLAVLLADLARADLLIHQRLMALPATEAADLLAALLESPADAGGALREQLLQRSGGVPFFLISYVRGRRSGVQPTEVPWDLAQTVRQRVAALPQAAQAVLGVAAVAGRRVGGALLLAVAAQPEEEVLAALEVACQAKVLEDTGETGYRFAHDVIREVVEADLGSARRSVLHRRIAEALEAEQGAPPLDVLAYHYARGEVLDKAVHYLEQAGDHARAQHANVAAAGYYRDLVVRLDRVERAMDAAGAREKWGAVLVTLARFDVALAVLERAADTYRAAGDLEGLGRVTAHIGHVYSQRGTPEEGVARIHALLRQLEARGPSPGLARLYTTLAELVGSSGHDDDQCLVAADRAVALARVVQDAYVLGRAEWHRGTALLGLGRLEEAQRALEAAIAQAEAVNDLATLGDALNIVGCIYEDRGAFARSYLYAERALAIAGRQGDPVRIVLSTTRRGMSAFFRGDWAAARVDYERAVTLSQQTGASWVSVYPLTDLGRLCLAEGAWEAAARLLDESSSIAVRRGNIEALRWAQIVLAERDVLAGQAEAARARLVPLLDRPGLEEHGVIFVLPPLAWASLELGEVGHAAALVEQGVRRARAGSNLRALVDALRVQALVCTQQQRWIEAARSVEEGLSLTRAMPYPYAEARLLHVYGELHLQRGEPQPARQRLEAGLAIFRRLGARKDVERVEQALSTLQNAPPRDAAVQAGPSLPTRQGAVAGALANKRLSRADRQAWALEHLRTAGPLSPRAYATALGVSVDTALRDLQELVDRDLVQAAGTTKDRRYVFVGAGIVPAIHRTVP